MKTMLLILALYQIPTEEDFWSGRHAANVLQGKYLRDDGEYRTNAEQTRHSGKSRKREQKRQRAIPAR